MINFIIYENSKLYLEKYQRIIHQFMANNNNHYKIYKYQKDSKRIEENINNLNGYNIYLLDIDNDNEFAIKIAHDIRTKKDFKYNQIIMTTSNIENILSTFHKKLLIIDFILKDNEIEVNLLDCFKEIFKLFNNTKALSIKCDGELIRIPHDDIIYIEKDKSDDYLFIHTEYDKYRYKSSMIDMENTLRNDMRFMRSHRSTIVNVNKIKKVDMTNNIIYFQHKYTNHLARDRKKDLENQIKIIGELI